MKVPKIIKDNSGIYLLEIKAESDFRVGIKKFSGLDFPAGYYYYAGSAQKNFKQRLNRHIRKDKIIHWHIDHITTIETNKITSILIDTGKQKEFECRLVQNLLTEFKLKSIAKGFGNSDCNICESHLLFSKKKISYSHFISLYQSMARLIPSSKEISW